MTDMTEDALSTTGHKAKKDGRKTKGFIGMERDIHPYT